MSITVVRASSPSKKMGADNQVLLDRIQMALRALENDIPTLVRNQAMD